jgi:hypothetical protein
MFELTIKNKDGSTYWVERFNSQTEAEKWLATEQTRKYWKEDFSWEIVDKTPPPPPPSQEELDRRAAILSLKQRIKELANQADLTAGEVKESIHKLIKLRALMKELD